MAYIKRVMFVYNSVVYLRGKAPCSHWKWMMGIHYTSPWSAFVFTVNLCFYFPIWTHSIPFDPCLFFFSSHLIVSAFLGMMALIYRQGWEVTFLMNPCLRNIFSDKNIQKGKFLEGLFHPNPSYINSDGHAILFPLHFYVTRKAWVLVDRI